MINIEYNKICLLCLMLLPLNYANAAHSSFAEESPLPTRSAVAAKPISYLSKSVNNHIATVGTRNKTYVSANSTPGPSAALFNNPLYQCVINKYVDYVNGDNNNPGTQAQPWKTIQNASNGYPNTAQPGECVNVVPGNYPITDTWVVPAGGNANTPTGFVVYRCEQMDACVLDGSSGINGDLNQVWVPYVVFDGFEFNGGQDAVTESGINGCAGGAGARTNLSHHLIVINNIFHGFGGSGVDSCNVEYLNWQHNIAYNNSGTNINQESGINITVPEATIINNRVPGDQDSVMFAYYHIIVAYNISYDNFELPSLVINGGHTDGNGIIMDTFLGNAAFGIPAYTGNSIVYGNTAYGNGGGGIHVFVSDNVTVANNIAYNNYLDTLNPGTARGDCSSELSTNTLWLNNICQTVVNGPGILADNRSVVTFANLPSEPDTGTWTNNIYYGAAVGCDNTSDCNASGNLNGVNPLFNNPSAGDFSLKAGSPAIGTGIKVPYFDSPKNIGSTQ